MEDPDGHIPWIRYNATELIQQRETSNLCHSQTHQGPHYAKPVSQRDDRISKDKQVIKDELDKTIKILRIWKEGTATGTGKSKKMDS
jgi:hypothetical protein